MWNNVLWIKRRQIEDVSSKVTQDVIAGCDIITYKKFRRDNFAIIKMCISCLSYQQIDLDDFSLGWIITMVNSSQIHYVWHIQVWRIKCMIWCVIYSILGEPEGESETSKVASCSYTFNI